MARYKSRPATDELSRSSACSPSILFDPCWTCDPPPVASADPVLLRRYLRLLAVVQRVCAEVFRTPYGIVFRGVVVPERGGALFRPIFLSRNGAPVHTVYYRNQFILLVNYLMHKMANLFPGKSLKLLPPDVRF